MSSARRTPRTLLVKLFLCAAVGFLAIGALFYCGMLQFNHPSAERYPVRGVDVSEYQGHIDWNVLSQQGISFAFIRATEGSSLVDEEFSTNWREAQNTNLRIGAYHFFSFDSPGVTQAEHFCSVVTPTAHMLPPVIDVEPYGDYGDIENEDALAIEMGSLLDYLETHYSIKPIIYTTTRWYPVIHRLFPEHAIWIRSVFAEPSNDMSWVFWQYSARMKLPGYDGEEAFIDMNVFNGSLEELESSYLTTS